MWQLWLKLCQWYNRKISQFFSWLGETVGCHPLITIALSVVVLGALASGLAFIKTENRAERLYLPRNSDSFQNLDKTEKYGFYRPTRFAEIILYQKGGNVLNKECFKDALNLHKLVITIPGYQDVCLPNLKSDPLAALSLCKTEQPLWIFHYTSNFDNLLPRLNSHIPKNAGLFQRVFGKANHDDNGKITSAQALRMVYHIKGVGIEDEVPEKINEWEKKFVEQMKEFDRNHSNCGSFVYNAERSLDDAISESAVSDVKFIALTYVFMISFACFMLGKYLNPLIGHGLLAIGGIQCVAFGILSGFGLTLLSQTPFVSIAGVLPFLVLGVGIDDMFIMLDELDRTHPDQPISKRISAVMRTVGPAITMTTMTDVLAFAVGTTSKFPAVVYFCTFAALSISLAFLFLITLFLAFMSYDCRRMNAGRRDMVPCLKAPPPRPGAPRWDEPVPQTSNKIMEAWGRFLMKPLTKGFVVVISVCFLAVGIYGTTFVNENFDRRDIAKDGSGFVRFINTAEEYFNTDTVVDLILEPGVNYSDPVIQQKINSLTKLIADNKFYRPTVRSWFTELQIWYKSHSTNTTKSLLGSLDLFLENQPQFRKDIMFSEDNSTIKASRLYCFLKGTFSSVTLSDAMTTLRDDLKDKTTLPVFENAYLFIFIEQFVSTLPETVRNLALATSAILVVTSLFLVNPLVILLVIVEFVALIFELLGLMYIWDVSLNSISMVNLVIAIGFAVDYSAHLAHAFVFSSQTSPEEKAVDALRTVGASVMMGGFSTFLGMIVTAFASAEVFRIFFKMFFGIVVIGLLHGLCFLPVWMSIFCRCQFVIHPEQDDVKPNPDSSSVRNGANFISNKDYPISIQNPALAISNEELDNEDIINSEDHVVSNINPALSTFDEEFDKEDIINSEDHVVSNINPALSTFDEELDNVIQSLPNSMEVKLSMSMLEDLDKEITLTENSGEYSQLSAGKNDKLNSETHETKM